MACFNLLCVAALWKTDSNENVHTCVGCEAVVELSVIFCMFVNIPLHLCIYVIRAIKHHFTKPGPSGFVKKSGIWPRL